MIKAIIFDNDGTIVDSEKIHREVELGVLRELGASMTKKEHDKYTGTTLFSIYTDLFNKKKVDVKYSVFQGMIHTKIKEKVENEGLEIFQSIKSLIIDAYNKGIPISVASSGTRWWANYSLKKVGLYDYFEYVVSGEDVKFGKPEPEIFLKVAKQMGINPKNCVVIEDSKSGVMAAKKANMKVFALTTTFPKETMINTGADKVISDLDNFNLNKILQKE